ncbi:MAG: heparan-alpha-glucosaminide N-acetyltransferase domain-containing protein [Ignavibacteriales bacterium]|nr:heparan-alpha-glucosaminide N-acetyltransferase domain-containing protein [Ignavibacteriales bacterium]
MDLKNRALFIDLLKGLALIIMIEVHVVNALLTPALRDTWWFARLNFINGLVAPSFSFASGLVFVLSLQKGIVQLRTFGKEFWRKVSRIGLIFFVGYSLHIPYYSFAKILANPTQSNLESLYTVDILQLISTGLIFLLLARIVIKSENGFYNFSLIITALVLIVSPITWSIDFAKYMPLFFANYFNKMHGSLFPGFPWWAFVFSGAYVAKYYIKARKEGAEKEFAKKLIIYGTAFYLISVIVQYILFPTQTAKYRPSPFFFFERFGVILFALGTFWFYLHNKENYKSLILDVSRESLLVYWVHLQLIYQQVILGKSLIQISRQDYNLFQCLIVTVVLIVLMLVLAKVWGNLKRTYPFYSRWLTVSVLCIATLIFFIR